MKKWLMKSLLHPMDYSFALVVMIKQSNYGTQLLGLLKKIYLDIQIQSIEFVSHQKMTEFAQVAAILKSKFGKFLQEQNSKVLLCRIRFGVFAILRMGKLLLRVIVKEFCICGMLNLEFYLKNLIYIKTILILLVFLMIIHRCALLVQIIRSLF